MDIDTGTTFLQKPRYRQDSDTAKNIFLYMNLLCILKLMKTDISSTKEKTLNLNN